VEKKDETETVDKKVSWVVAVREVHWESEDLVVVARLAPRVPKVLKDHQETKVLRVLVLVALPVPWEAAVKSVQRECLVPRVMPELLVPRVFLVMLVTEATEERMVKLAARVFVVLKAIRVDKVRLETRVYTATVDHLELSAHAEYLVQKDLLVLRASQVPLV